MIVTVLSICTVETLGAEEITLKYISSNEFTLNIMKNSKIETFKLVKRKANIPTMMAEDDGIISNLHSEVGNTVTLSVCP